MSTIPSRPMSLLHVDFQELYERHLCRHSQFGINVVHLAALIGVWGGVYGFLYALAPFEWLPITLALAYLAIVAVNSPVRVTLATAVFLVAFLGMCFSMPQLPLWVYPLIIVVCYEIQSLSHKIFSTAKDMTEFNRKYLKGTVLFLVLLVYEVPFALNYLVFDKRSWSR
jgi:hypothetical protein